MTEIFQIAEFLRKVRSRLRFGERSRGQLQLMRIEVRNSDASCDWVARPVDEWDAYIPLHEAARNFTAQTLDDAIGMRNFLFGALGAVNMAELRAFRLLPGGEHELILSGTAYRDDKLPARNISLAMRAKLLGFHFTVTDGSMMRLASPDDFSSNSYFDASFPSYLNEANL